MNISWPPGPQQQTRSSMWLPNRTDGRQMPNGCTYPTCTLHSANYDISTKKAVWVPYYDELQGHREFPFWMLKISPCCTQIPAAKDASNTSNIWFVWLTHIGVIGLHYLYTDTYTRCGTRNHVCEMRAWIAQRKRKFWGAWFGMLRLAYGQCSQPYPIWGDSDVASSYRSSAATCYA